MHIVLALFGIVAAVVLISGAAITLFALHRAPDGFEDENGFQFLPAGRDAVHAADPVANRGGIRLA